MTLKLFPATYEGNRIIKLNQDLEGVQQHQAVMVMVVPAAENTFTIEDVGLPGLEQFLTENEQRFGMSSAKFSERFLRGEMGDDPDYILWAGAYEIYQRIAPKQQPSDLATG